MAVRLTAGHWREQGPSGESDAHRVDPRPKDSTMVSMRRKTLLQAHSYQIQMSCAWRLKSALGHDSPLGLAHVMARPVVVLGDAREGQEKERKKRKTPLECLASGDGVGGHSGSQ